MVMVLLQWIIEFGGLFGTLKSLLEFNYLAGVCAGVSSLQGATLLGKFRGLGCLVRSVVTMRSRTHILLECLMAEGIWEASLVDHRF